MKLSISGEVQRIQGSRGGTYFLKEDKTNNKHFWIHQSGGMAIWWDNDYDNWKVGTFEGLGSSLAGIIGPSNYDGSPNQISNGWSYSTDPDADDPWADAKINEILFEDWTFIQGKFLHSLCKIFMHAE